MVIEESENIEFKVMAVDAIKREVVAFANSGGGTLYVGIADNGEVEGLADAPTDLTNINNMLRDGIKPDITMFAHAKIEKIDQKTIISISVQRGTQRPYYLTGKGIRPEGVYLRHGTASVPATDTSIRRMIRETDGEGFENIRSTEQNLTFTETEAEFTQRNVAFGDSQMATLGLTTPGKVYTNLAYLLSDQCSYTIKAAVFQDTTQNVFQDRREFSGSLFKQLNDVYNYLDLNNRLGATIHKLYRVDQRDYPEVALREALLNAIVHREYATRSSTLIKFFSDRVEFISPGALANGIELDDISSGISTSRNIMLADVFYRLQLIEVYGTGIVKIFQAYKAAKARPTIAVTSNVFKITLPILSKTSGDTPYSEMSVNETQQPYLTDSEQRRAVLSPERLQTEKILGHIQVHGSITRRKAETLLDLGQTATGLVLRKMVENGQLSKLGKGPQVLYYRA